MKLSNYNFEIPIKDNKLIVFNTLTGAIVRIPRHAYTTKNIALINHRFVVPKNINELDLYKFRFMSAIYASQFWHITIAPTMQCNFKCPYCFEGNNKTGDAMNECVINSLKRFLKLKSDKFINITWFGGEPFLGWRVIAEISEFLISEDIRFSANAITNGSICSESIISKIDEYKIRRIQITLDGNRKTHDSKRIFKTGQPSFDLLIKNIHTYLNQTSVKVVIRINLDKNNINDYPELQSFLQSEFHDYIENHRIKISPSPVKNRTQFEGCSNCLSNEDYHKFEQSTLSIKKKLPKRYGPCSLRCRSSIGIGPDGSVYKCLEHFGDQSKAVGSLLTNTIDFNKEAQYAVGVLPFDIAPCSSCKLLPICGGGCAIDLQKCADGQHSPSCFINDNILREQILNYYGIKE